MHSNRENRSWLRCSSKWLAVIFLQTTEMVSAVGIWKQSMQKELTAPGFITGMGWKMRRLCMLEPNWQGETRNHIGLGSWDCEQGKMLYPDARFWFKVTEHLGGRRFSCFTAFAHSLFLPPTISFLFFLGIFLLIASFSLLEPDAKPSKIDGKFSVDLAICSLCPSKFSVFELDDVYSCFSFFFFAGVNVKETASLNCCGNLKFVLKWVLFGEEKKNPPEKQLLFQMR